MNELKLVWGLLRQGAEPLYRKLAQVVCVQLTR